jgi:hypothetical protein
MTMFGSRLPKWPLSHNGQAQTADWDGRIFAAPEVSGFALMGSGKRTTPRKRT